MKSQKQSDVSVLYTKFYVDDTGKHISNIFSDVINQVNVKNLWEGVVDAFYNFECVNYFACLHGDLRIVIATDQGNSNYKFNQYFISGLDGKIIKIQPQIWFGIHNLNSGNSVLINGFTGNGNNFERMSSKIFNWHSKR